MEAEILKMVQKRLARRFNQGSGLLAYYNIFSNAKPDWSNLSISSSILKNRTTVVYSLTASPCERVEFGIEITYDKRHDNCYIYIYLKDIYGRHNLQGVSVRKWHDIIKSLTSNTLSNFDKRIGEAFTDLEAESIVVKAKNLQDARDLNDILTAYLIAR